jgi:hypothetical protein
LIGMPKNFAFGATGPMRKVGTFTPRAVSERFLAERAVGWIHGADQIDVTIRLAGRCRRGPRANAGGRVFVYASDARVDSWLGRA